MSQIRNFCIIAHIDHGKSTLADRFLELTGTITVRERREQYLDSMPLEREKGITIKMQPVRMSYKFAGQDYVLNLIDTPGHVDFSYEVSRGLAAVEGAILLVDVTKGVQAQTLYNLNAAHKQNLVVIPALNKVDLKHASVEQTRLELNELLGPQQILEVSAKEGLNCEQLLQTVIQKIAAPTGDVTKPLRALVFDSEYDPYQGVIAYVRVVDGQLKAGQQLRLCRRNSVCLAKEVGVFAPRLVPNAQLVAGEIGYVATGIKDPGLVRVGETITSIEQLKLEPLPGYKEPHPVVFMGLYPEDAKQFGELKKALEQLHLQDPAFSFEPEQKSALGQGFRCGFLGNLHAEIIVERLKREFNLALAISRPQVVYELSKGGQSQFIYSSRDFPEHSANFEIKERWVSLEVVLPQNFLGPVLSLLNTLEGQHKETKNLGQDRLILVYETPLRELMTSNFYEKLKSVSQGFASLSYELTDWRQARLVKMDILLAGEAQELLSQIVPVQKVNELGRQQVEKLKELLPKEQFALAIQAAVGGKIVARETLAALRKDVTGYLYGGDYSRKRKLLEKQKKGKKILKAAGRVNIAPDTFLKILRS